MKNFVILFALIFLSISVAVGSESVRKFQLPAGAVIVETADLKPEGYPNRTIVLWMLNPVRNPSGFSSDPDYFYTCPDYTRGSHYTGPARVSLIDNTSNTIINTVEVKKEYFDGEDSFDIPYAILPGYYYQVEGKPVRNKEAKARVLALRDYNGDGKALEFALFDALACMGLPTALIGYSAKQDKVIQYKIRLESKEGNKSSVNVFHWCDYLFSTKPQKTGYWKYDIDYRGRGGSLNKYEIRYNVTEEMFEGSFRGVADIESN